MRWECLAERETRQYFVIRRTGRELFDADLAAFRPSVPHESIVLEEQRTSNNQFIVEGVRITLEDWVNEIEATIEGELAPDARDLILSELVEYLRGKTECVWIPEEMPEGQLPSKQRLSGLLSDD